MDSVVFGEATLANCEREAIHIPGSIQPHGVLLALDPANFQILQIAGDVEALLGVDAAELQRQGVAQLFGEALFQRLRGMLAAQTATPRPLLIYDQFASPRMLLEAAIHAIDGVFVIELMPSRGDPAQAGPLALVQAMLTDLRARTSPGQFLQGVADEIHRLTGFSRVMIYQFLDDESGHVIAEAKSPDIDSYLDLHYPASDIPRQARAMYLSNWIRLIPDATYQALPITPAINPLTGQPLDLTYSVLRSVSPLHLEYLANMGVKASMSLSIVVRGKLWGLIACYHFEPLYLANNLRGACELFAQLASLQLEEKLANVDHGRRLQVKTDHSSLVEAMMREERLEDGLIRYRPNLRDLIMADGVVIWWEGHASKLGKTPTDSQLAGLVEWLDSKVDEGVFITDHLVANYPAAAEFIEVGAGLVALSISRSPNDYIIWFRAEYIQTVTWGGDPHAKLAANPDGVLRPRTSFAAWRETVREHSEPWDQHTLEAANALRISILEVVLRRIDEAAREREKAKAHQDFLMAELDHRVKNSLATIQSLVWHSAKSTHDLDEFTQSLQQRLQSMARAHSLLTHSRWEGADLRQIIEEELTPFQDAVGRQRFDLNGPKVSLRPKAALALSLSIHELTTNAVKYGALSAQGGRISVEWRIFTEPERTWLRLVWKERDGPPVVAPERKGFGRTLIEKSLAFDIEGQADLDFQPDGVCYTAMIPFDQVIEAEPARRTVAAATATRVKVDLQGKRIMLVEDGALIAMQAEATLQDEGIEVIGPVGQLEHAVRLAGEEILDGALLDIDLHGQHTWEVADRLAERGIPFAFTSGFAGTIFPPRFKDAKSIAKPYTDAQLTGIVEAMLAAGGK